MPLWGLAASSGPHQRLEHGLPDLGRAAPGLKYLLQGHGSLLCLGNMGGSLTRVRDLPTARHQPVYGTPPNGGVDRRLHPRDFAASRCVMTQAGDDGDRDHEAQGDAD